MAAMDDIQENSVQSSLPDQKLLSIDEELWLMAEERAQEILCTIQPNVLSEVNRKDIIDYVQRLIGGYYGAEVFPFGSVPLKTYLPDGDIDLTALSHENVEEEVAQAVYSILENGDDPEYQIKDIQYIRAQVKLIKCTVKNIAVDISFNQMAGLYAMRFLEQVDQLVGKDHLFKRSIILVKAWCYYESRILGAHHGLLSTYAMETLVLYIINRYHSSVRGSLEVLYRFLDFYSTFDWDSSYLSIDGPVALSTLPEIVEKPECERGGLLLSKEFVKNYRDMCSAQAKATETVTREFQSKNINILDPLKHDNNLGRSVSRGNLHRIRFALSFGARKLKEILKLPGESMGAALEKFFMNTLNRNGKGQRADVDVPVPAFGTGRSEESVLVGDCDSYYDGLQYIQLYRSYSMPFSADSNSPSTPSQTDMLMLSTQQNWSMFYHSGTNLYVPTQAFYHPNASQATYSLEEGVKSRGTGTYIPDMTHNSYWDMRARVTRPRRYSPHGSDNASPRSHQRKQPEEVHSEPDMNDSPRSFELSNEDFPILSSIRNTKSSAAPESSQSTEQQDQSSSSSQLNIEFGTYGILQSLPELRLGTEDQKEGSGVSFSQSMPELSLGTEDQKEGSDVSFSQSLPELSLGSEDQKEGSGVSFSQSLSELSLGIEDQKEGSGVSFSQSLPELSVGTEDQKEGSGVSFSQPLTEVLSLGTDDQKVGSGVSFSQPLTEVLSLGTDDQKVGSGVSFSQPLTELSWGIDDQKEGSDVSFLQSLTELSLGTEDQKVDYDVSSSQGTTLVVPSVAAESDEKMD